MPIPPTRNFETGEPDPAIQALRRKLAWRYPLEAASQHPSKLSVSSLRRQQGNWESEPAEAASADFGSPSAKYSPAKGGLAATEVGLAHHRFLECARLERLTERAAIGQEIQRLISIGSLSEIQAETLDQAALSRFWSSEIGGSLLAARDNLHRELPFTMAIQVSELVALNLVPSDDAESKEKLILQGVVDLTMISPTEIWILDFKTDRISRRDLPDRVRHHQTQLRLYSLALGRIYNRPVTQAWLHFLKTGDTIPMAL
jgi:ATP-dependent helicase/nuclease subunit A